MSGKVAHLLRRAFGVEIGGRGIEPVGHIAHFAHQHVALRGPRRPERHIHIFQRIADTRRTAAATNARVCHQFQFKAGMRVTEFHQPRRDNVRSEDFTRRQANRAVITLAGGRKIARQRRKPPVHRLQRLNQLLACRRQPVSSPLALKEPRPEIILQRRNTAQHRRRIHAKLLPGPRQTARPRHRKKIPQIVPIHHWTLIQRK